MKGKKLAQLVGSLGLVTVIVLAIFLLLNSGKDDSIFSKEEKLNTEAQNILAKDIDRNYPAIVREVVSLFGRISKCYYNETISEQEFLGLIEMQRKLFDEEFLDNNPLDTFTNNLTAEIDAAKAKKSVMMTWKIQKQSSVVTWQDGENSFARIVVSFVMNEKEAGFTETFEEFLLREDAAGRWKIVGWRLTDPMVIEN